MVDTTANTEVSETGRFRIERDFAEQPVVLRVFGELDITTAPMLDEQLPAVEAAAEPPAPVVVDLTGVSFLASAGLSVLVHFGQHFAELGSQLRVIATDRAVTRPISMTGLGEVVVVFASEDEARAGA